MSFKNYEIHWELENANKTMHFKWWKATSWKSVASDENVKVYKFNYAYFEHQFLKLFRRSVSKLSDQ